MAVLVTTDIYGNTQIEYDELLAAIEKEMKRAPGFILHSSHRIKGGWRLIEVWNSKEQASKFFRDKVVPNVRSKDRPLRMFQDLHSYIKSSKRIIGS